ncbi:MAG: hypothetical protein J6I64_02975, partial [Lachnospiraceae bacterium]|nr:hypothetical protein [Lachnospiraceae bacterium]
YQGSTISEMVFGGMLVSSPILLLLGVLPRMKTVLKKKRLYAFVLVLVVGALIIVGADVQMSGMLQRYFADFGVWLFVAASILWMATEETYGERGIILTLRRVLLALTVITCVYHIMMFFAVDLDSVWEHNPALYIRLSHDIQFWR